MIAGHYGLQFDLASLRARYPVSLKGTTLLGLVAIARDMRLDTRAVRCDPDDLGGVRLPCILHWRMDHFVVLVSHGRRRCVLHDPAAGRIVVSRAELDASFTGVALEAWPNPNFARQDRRGRLCRLCARSCALLPVVPAPVARPAGAELQTSGPAVGDLEGDRDRQTRERVASASWTLRRAAQEASQDASVE
jgi:hypothetical protein